MLDSDKRMYYLVGGSCIPKIVFMMLLGSLLATQLVGISYGPARIATADTFTTNIQ